jgi:hypothetical protein
MTIDMSTSRRTALELKESLERLVHEEEQVRETLAAEAHATGLAPDQICGVVGDELLSTSQGYMDDEKRTLRQLLITYQGIREKVFETAYVLRETAVHELLQKSTEVRQFVCISEEQLNKGRPKQVRIYERALHSW